MTLTSTRAARSLAISAALAGSLSLAACGASNESASTSSSGGSSSAQLSGTLNGAGSSAQQAAMTAWQAGIGASGVTVNYDPVGSGGGRTQFLAGGINFAGSDAALTDDELSKASSVCGTTGVFELPNYISAIAVVYHLDGVDNLQLAPATIAKIFAGTITTWNDPAVAADNPGVTLPNTAIAAVHRSDNSGTTNNFTDYLSKTAATDWTNAPSGDWPLQGGEGATGTSGVVAAVKAGAGAIGYADESQAKDLGIAKIKVGSSYVAPSADGAAKVVANSPAVSGRGQYDLAVAVNRTTTATDEYPITLVSYHIGCVKYSDANTGKLVKAFENYVISSDGQAAAAKNAGSAPITDAIRQKSQAAVDAIS